MLTTPLLHCKFDLKMKHAPTLQRKFVSLPPSLLTHSCKDGQHIQRFSVLCNFSKSASSWNSMEPSYRQDSNITTITKKAQQCMHFLRQLHKLSLSQALLAQFHTAVIESVITLSVSFYSNST